MDEWLLGQCRKRSESRFCRAMCAHLEQLGRYFLTDC